MEQPRTPDQPGDFFANDKRNQWMLFAACALFNIVLACLFRAPYAYPDEYGVFANGNWMFGGVSWDYKPSMYYGYTFSPFVGLLMQFFEGIRPVYIGSLCIKAIQLSFIPVLCYKLLHEVLDAKNPRMKLLLSSIACLYPAVVLYAKYVSNETTLHLILFICLYLFGKCAVSQQKGLTRFYSALIGFLAAFSYATHGMGLAFIVAICFTIPAAHILTKKRLVSYPIFIISLALFYFLDAQIKSALMDAVYTTAGPGAINTIEFGLSRLLATFVEPGAMWSTIHIFWARLLYIMAATFGTFPLAIIVMLVFAYGFLKARFTEKTLDPQDIALFVVALFSLAIFLCGISLSTLSSMQTIDTISGKSYFYGRYYEYMALPLVMVGLYYIFYSELSKKRLLCYSIIVIVCYTLLSIYVRLTVIPILADETTNYFFTLGVVPFIGNTSVYIDVDSEVPMYFNLYTLWLFTVVVFSSMMYLIIVKNFRRMAVSILLTMFLYGTIYNLNTNVLHLSLANYNYFYSHLAPLRTALDDFKDVYEQHPSLYVVTNNVGSLDSPESLVLGRSQLSFFRYNVAGVVRPHLFLEVEDSETLFHNAILVSDVDLGLEELVPEDFDLETSWSNDRLSDGGYIKIYESPDAHIWIRGEEIRAYYESRDQ